MNYKHVFNKKSFPFKPLFLNPVLIFRPGHPDDRIKIRNKKNPLLWKEADSYRLIFCLHSDTKLPEQVIFVHNFNCPH